MRWWINDEISISIVSLKFLDPVCHGLTKKQLRVVSGRRFHLYVNAFKMKNYTSLNDQ